MTKATTQTIAEPVDAMNINQWIDALACLELNAQATLASLPPTHPDDDTEAPTPTQEGRTPDSLTATLPPILRIQSIERTLTSDGHIHNRAVLFHERCSVCVDWISQQTDTRLHRHGLATMRPARYAHCNGGAVRIDRLLPAERADSTTNLFHTVPSDWVRDRALVRRAARLWEALPRNLAQLFNTLFWENGRFHRYVMGPSSTQGHHNALNGNLHHSVEVAEIAHGLAGNTELANPALLILGGLLHDAGKADEYRYDRVSRSFRLSVRGELVGHRDTLIEWLAVARDRSRVTLSDDEYLALLHTLGASKGAPPWLGLREPRCIEAEILSLADRLSGMQDLHRRCAPADGQSGFGTKHPHIGRRTFVTRRAA